MDQSKNVLRMQPEWDAHEACWLAWPGARDLWKESLPEAQKEFVALCRAISGIDIKSDAAIEPIHLLVPKNLETEARNALVGIPTKFFEADYGDIWVRDTGPIFVDTDLGQAAACFRFNGWGGKYTLPHDDQVAAQISRLSARRPLEFPWILEGGAVEVDGQGTCLTTRQCLLNPNRSPGVNEKEIEARLREGLGIRRTIWIDEGLRNDHTDGHIDTLARFVAPGRVVCMYPEDSQDPNREVLLQIRSTLLAASDARGQKLEVVEVPSPGLVQDEDGRVQPASFLNFYISNRTVVVPTYGTVWDDAAVEAIARCFPGRVTLGSPARAILSGGGAFHCITQQQPIPEGVQKHGK